MLLQGHRGYPSQLCMTFIIPYTVQTSLIPHVENFTIFYYDTMQFHLKKKKILNFYTNLIIIEMMEPVFILLHQFIYRTIFTKRM